MVWHLSSMINAESLSFISFTLLFIFNVWWTIAFFRNLFWNTNTLKIWIIMSEKLTEEYLACQSTFQSIIFKHSSIRSLPDMPVQAKRGGRGTAPHIHSPDTRKGGVVRTTAWPLYLPEETSTHCTGGRMGLRAIADGMENSPPMGFDTPDCPACTESLYWWYYPSHLLDTFLTKNCMLIILCGLYTEKSWRWGHLTSPIWYSRINGHLFNTCTEYWRLLLPSRVGPFKCQVSAASWCNIKFKYLWWENILPFQTKMGNI